MLIGFTIECCFKLRQLSAIVYNYKCDDQASLHLFFLFMFRTGFMLYVKRSHLRDALWLPCQTSVKYTCFLRYIPYTLLNISWDSDLDLYWSCLLVWFRLDTSFKLLLKNFLVSRIRFNVQLKARNEMQPTNKKLAAKKLCCVLFYGGILDLKYSRKITLAFRHF